MCARIFVRCVTRQNGGTMPDLPEAQDRYARLKLEEHQAVLDGITSQIYSLDQNIRQWRETTNRTFNLLSQRDAADTRERKDRQAFVDLNFWWLKAGIIAILVTIVAVGLLYIGSRFL